MNLRNPNPTETSLGMSYVRDDLLQQEPRNSRAGRVARWFKLIARVFFVLLVVGILAVVEWGLGATIGWIGTYLFPVVVMVGVVIAALALLVWAVKRLPTSPLRDWYQ